MMTNTPPLHPFLESLRTEHKEILAELELCLGRSDSANTAADQESALRDFFRFAKTQVEEHHHAREELLLFSAITHKAEIRAGGPLCMLYFDLHLSRHPLDRAAAATKTARIQPSSIEMSDLRRGFYDNNSPVCIPVEDHLAGEQITRHALTLLEASPRSEELKNIHHLSYIYLDILKGHFEKEDSCLFPMSQILLSSEELDHIGNQSVPRRTL